MCYSILEPVLSLSTFLLPISNQCAKVMQSKMSGCQEMRITCPKFRVPFTKGENSGYPACSKNRLDLMEIKALPGGKTYR